MALGAGGSRPDARQAGPDRGRRAGRDGHQPELRAGRRRQRQPGQPGHRRPLLRRRPAGGGRAGRGAGEGAIRAPGSRPPPSTSPGTATPSTDSHTGLPVITPHPRAVGGAGRAAVPGRDRRRHRLDHDRAHRRPGARPVRGPGDAVPPDPHRHPARGARLRRRRGHRLARHGGRARRSTATTGCRSWRCKAGVDQLLNPPDLDVAWNAVLDAVAGAAR